MTTDFTTVRFICSFSTLEALTFLKLESNPFSDVIPGISGMLIFMSVALP